MLIIFMGMKLMYITQLPKLLVSVAMAISPSLLLVLLQLIISAFCQGDDFVSIDCGGESNYTDPSTGLYWVSDAGHTGNVSSVPTMGETRPQYKFYRYFPPDARKYCYSLNTTERRRYLVRATFLYGDTDTDTAGTYPMFKLYMDTTEWATVTIKDASRVYVEELIIRAQSASVHVCVCCASTGYPFVSTIELRPLNHSMYMTDYEDNFFLKVAARVNFGALSIDSIRYPDDPYDRIWESDLIRRQNFLVGMAPGTKRIRTDKSIFAEIREFPPPKVMQTAVVGTKGSLSYRLDLEGFPGNARAYAYLAEIEDLRKDESRKFTMQQPYVPGYNSVVVNIAENANGSYALYEPSYMNVSLDFVLALKFSKTRDSTYGPLLNAIEVSKYVQIVPQTDIQDVAIADAFCALSSTGEWRFEEGDPCIPARWGWVNCSSSTPSRITKLFLSNKDLKGAIPSQIKQMEQLAELWLDGNSLNGQIPDMSSMKSLTIVHLENNRLTGPLPSYFAELPNLRELYVQNNSLSGNVPLQLLNAKFIFKYDSNPGLNLSGHHNRNFKFVLFVAIGATICFAVFLLGFFWMRRIQRRKPLLQDESDSFRITSKLSTPYSIIRGSSLVLDDGVDVACYVSLADIEEATCKFSRKIGEGSFGSVYYGKMRDGKEVAVKISADQSGHGTQQFVNEVALLSRIHHRNLVPLVGYCEEGCQRILVYEYMHNGTLRGHIHDSVKKKNLNWMSRLQLAEDAAKGLVYLHTGCIPSIIHRDVKTSNILLDIHMKAKVSDFGLSRQADESRTHVSSVARGTVGYLDPEYYAHQQLTDKSDVYSFGVVLLELISGRKPFSAEDYGYEWNIVHWARSLVRKGDVASIIDPSLKGTFKMESLWRIAEIAVLSVEPHGVSRPRMQEIEIAIQDAIMFEKSGEELSDTSSISDTLRLHARYPSSTLEIVSSESLSNVSIPCAR